MGVTIGILLSGSGSTYDNLARRISADGLAVRVGVVVASRAGVGGLELAAGHGHRSVIAGDQDTVSAAIEAAACEWVFMCGFMRRWDPPPALLGRVVNIHPSLLPAFGGQGFYGDRVHRAVLASGATLSGCSVHLVEGDYDSGPILAQRVVPVYPDDDVAGLRQRVQAAERHCYPLVLQSLVRHGIVHQAGRPRLRAVPGCDAQDFGFLPGTGD